MTLTKRKSSIFKRKSSIFYSYGLVEPKMMDNCETGWLERQSLAHSR
jgi:hypothetical protein